MTHPENESLAQWLAREVPETVLEPELPIVDPHHHLWDLRKATTDPYAPVRLRPNSRRRCKSSEPANAGACGRN